MIKYEDQYYIKPDGKIGNHFNDLEESNKLKVRELVKEWCAEFCRTSTYRKIVNDKIREEEDKLTDEQSYLDKLFTKKVKQEGDELSWTNWFIERSQARCKAIEKRLRSWHYKKQIALGKNESKELNIQGAKEVPIGDVLGTPEFKSNGRSFYKCPIHNEKTASFCWYEKDNKWRCYGACGRGGDVIDLYQLINNVSFSEAVKSLTNN